MVIIKHEGVWWRRHSSMHSSLRQWMMVSGEGHAFNDLPPGEELPTPIAWEAGLVPEKAWTLWRRQISLLPLPGIKPQFLDRLVPGIILTGLSEETTWLCIRFVQLLANSERKVLVLQRNSSSLLAVAPALADHSASFDTTHHSLPHLKSP